jgi:hypothetical protein
MLGTNLTHNSNNADLSHQVWHAPGQAREQQRVHLVPLNQHCRPPLLTAVMVRT